MAEWREVSNKQLCALVEIFSSIEGPVLKCGDGATDHRHLNPQKYKFKDDILYLKVGAEELFDFLV